MKSEPKVRANTLLNNNLNAGFYIYRYNNAFRLEY